MRHALPATLCLTTLLGLAACAPSIPDSAAGVGFENTQPQPYTTGLGAPLPPPDAVSTETLPDQPFSVTPATPTPGSVQGASSGNVPGAIPSDPGTSDDIAADTAAALAAARANSGVLPVEASPTNAAPETYTSTGISDENDFQAVASRESIASDAQRLAQQRSQFEVITPTAVPGRPGGSSDPNIVQYALSTNHARGTRMYTRSGINLASRAQRNCAKYSSADLAQTDFLARGGPDRDRLSLDPDGDGYACGWDPAPFRKAVN
ncbi:MAG: hypothetical protein CML68_21285 [Rhodobacteraceae bacterium]|nr:hypothetical protein [Paracoccaceae bacterium]